MNKELLDTSTDAATEELVKENTFLRALAKKIMPCHYCGAQEIALCPYGFPGCALADDLFIGEQQIYRRIRDQQQLLDKVNRMVTPESEIGQVLRGKP